MKDIDREEILADEYTRPKEKGVRIFSTGITRLCRKLRLAIALNKEEVKKDEHDTEREMLAVAFLLDEHNPEDIIKARADLGPEWVHSEELDRYDFNLPVELMALIRREIDRTNLALSALNFKIEAKPRTAGAPPDPVPVGKS